MFDIDLTIQTPRYTPESLCQGIVQNPLCDDCTRLTPGPKTKDHFVNPPGHNRSCTCYRSKKYASGVKT
jgi:hypothetical protein